MSFNPSEDCPGETCLENLNFTDLTCKTYSELLQEFNNRTDLLAQAICCVAESIPEETFPATMTIRGEPNDTGLGPRNLTELVFVEDPDNRLTSTGGGIRIDKTGVYTAIPEITIISGGYAHAAAYANGSLISNEFPNASTTTSDDSNAIQIVTKTFTAGTIIKSGMSISNGNPSVRFANLTVIYEGT